MTIRLFPHAASRPAPGSRLARHITGWSLVLALAATPPAPAEAAAFEPRFAARKADGVLRVEVPSAAVAAGALWTPEFRERLDRLVRTVPTDADWVVVLVDERGTPVRPDHEAARSLAAAAEPALQFTFNSPGQPWTADELAALQGYVAEFLPAMRDVYGPPAFGITVNVRRDSLSSAAGLYYPYANEVVLRRLNPYTLCHEILHAFRDDATIDISAYEEGTAMAATIAVFSRSPYEHAARFHGSFTDVYYDVLNVPAAEALGGDILVAPSRSLLRYYLAGYAWSKPFLEDGAFLREFNRRYLERFAVDPTVAHADAALAGIAATVRPTCEGQDFAAWRSRQHAICFQPPLGLGVYQRAFEPNGATTVDVYVREGYGGETPQAGVLVDWEARTHDGGWTNSGTTVTNSAGSATFSPSLPPGYSGRVHITASCSCAAGSFTSQTIRHAGAAAPQGVFGACAEQDTGTVVLTPLDPYATPFEATVVNGAFEAPGLQSVSGRIRLDLWSGGYVGSRTITKDASAYCVVLTPANLQQMESAGIRLEARPSVTSAGTYLRLSAPLPTAARLTVHDVAGRLVRSIIVPAGRDGAPWDGTGDGGAAVPPGLYFVRLATAGAAAHARVVVL